MKWTLLGCFFLLSLSTYAHAQAVDQQSELDEEMQVLVRSYVTQHPEVSIDDAITRLTIQTEILHVMESFRQEFAGRLTEISIQPVPDQHILVELSGSAPVANRTISTRSGNTKVVFETGHRDTNEAFQAIIDKHRELLYQTIPGITGWMGQPGEDRLVIHIEGNEQQAEVLQASISELERVLGLSISLRPNMARSINL